MVNGQNINNTHFFNACNCEKGLAIIMTIEYKILLLPLTHLFFFNLT